MTDVIRRKLNMGSTEAWSEERTENLTGAAGDMIDELRPQIAKEVAQLLNEGPTFGNGEILELSAIQTIAAYYMLGVMRVLDEHGGIRGDDFSTLVGEASVALSRSFASSLVSFFNNAFGLQMDKQQLIDCCMTVMKGAIEEAAGRIAEKTKEIVATHAEQA